MTGWPLLSPPTTILSSSPGYDDLMTVTSLHLTWDITHCDSPVSRLTSCLTLWPVSVTKYDFTSHSRHPNNYIIHSIKHWSLCVTMCGLSQCISNKLVTASHCYPSLRVIDSIRARVAPTVSHPQPPNMTIIFTITVIFTFTPLISS